MQMDEVSLARAIEAVEGKLEYSNVTNLRQELLGVVERLQKNPAVRFLILKHGRPQAVLMSFHTYELLKKVMNQALREALGRSREEAIQAAFERLRAERPPTHFVPEEVSEGVSLAAATAAFKDASPSDTILEEEDQQVPPPKLAE